MRLLPGVVIAVAVPIWLVGSTAASGPSTSTLRGELNQIRSSLGMRPLGRSRTAQALVRRLAAADFSDRAPATLDDQPGCAVCARRGHLGIGLWRTGWTAEQNLSVFFRTAALALDPRARTFSAAPTRKGLLVVAIAIDARARWTAPVRWPQGAIDPRRQLWIDVLLPPGVRGKARLVERRGTETVIVAEPLADARGVEGSRLVAFGLNAELAFGHRYRARVGDLAVPFATRPLPASLMRPSWRLVDLTPAERATFLGVFDRGPPLLRRIARELDGRVRVVGADRGCFSADACEHLHGTQASISFGRVEPFVVLHEFGHIELDLGLDQAGALAFQKAFTHSPRWRGGCCPFLHSLFADQFAFWALGGRPRGIVSYGYPQLLSQARFGELLADNHGYRPPPVLGPLPPPAPAPTAPSE